MEEVCRLEYFTAEKARETARNAHHEDEALGVILEKVEGAARLGYWYIHHDFHSLCQYVVDGYVISTWEPVSARLIEMGYVVDGQRISWGIPK